MSPSPLLLAPTGCTVSTEHGAPLSAGARENAAKDRVVPNQVPAGATGAETHLVEQKFFQDTELHS